MGATLRRLFMVFCLLATANRLAGQSLVGTWVGVQQQPDSGFVCPLPLLLQVRADSTYTLSLLDNAAAMPRATWLWRAGQLRLDTATFLARQVTLTATDLHLAGPTPMTFRRLVSGGTPPAIAALETALTNRIWQYGNRRYHLHRGGQACLETAGSDQRTLRCWTLTERDGAVFLVIKGNQIDCSRNYESPWQVLTINATELIVRQYGLDQTDTLTWRAGAGLVTGGRCGARGFQRCSNCFYAPYNQANGLTKKGPPGRFYAIRQALLTGLDSTRAPGQTGLVQVRCVVNCEGRAGEFSAQTYTANYQPAPNNPALTGPLLSLLQTQFAEGWQPGKQRHLTRPLDYVATINVRFQNGQITDVFP